MYLKELLAESKNFDKDFGMQEVKSISKDCEKPQQVYFCLTNDYSKAKSRALTALQNGATYVISNFDLPFNNSFKVHDVRNVFAHSAKKFYHNACDDMIMIGICGTNGKTSTSHIIGQMLKHQNKKVGILGTSGVYYNGKSFDCPLTTPDADSLHKTFLEMKNDGVEYVVMEVSAHAIEQKRINGINFDIGVLTNITQDHLDYFKTMQDYEKTKLSFFSPEHVKRAIVCADDERAKKLIDICQVPLYTYGLDSYCDYMAKKVNCSLNGSNYISKIYGEEFQAKTNLIGRYNVYNSLAAIAVGNVLGFKNKDFCSTKYT